MIIMKEGRESGLDAGRKEGGKYYILMPLLNYMAKYKLSIIIEKDENGYFAFCPELQGCYTQGDSYEEVIENVKDAIRLHIEDRIANNEEIPKVELTSLATIEIEA